MPLQHIDLSERSGHRMDHRFTCGAEFNVKIRRHLNIPDFVREQLSESEINDLWWEEAERSRDDLRASLQRRYKWIGELVFVGRGPGWLAIEDTGCKSRNWDAVGKVVEKHLKEFIASMEDARTWREVRGVSGPTSASMRHHSTKKPASASGDRRVWAFLDGEPFSATVKKGQDSSAAVARSLKRRLGADVTLWPQEATPSGAAYRAQWFDPKSDRFREARVEIWRL